MERAVFRTKGLTKIYGSGDVEVRALDGVDVTLCESEMVVLLGPSGSGKTTLLNLLAGIDDADTGRVEVGGLDLGRARGKRLAAWRAETVGYVFQQANLVPVLTAWENVELPLWLFPFSRAERRSRVSLALEAVGLADRAGHLPRQLSGGQEQRVAIARAIVADPPLLVADEPTGNLDAESAEGILKILTRLNQERGKTVVLVTHDQRAARIGSRVMLLDKGRLSPAEVPA